jgi:hypothetical protein
MIVSLFYEASTLLASRRRAHRPIGVGRIADFRYREVARHRYDPSMARE